MSVRKSGNPDVTSSEIEIGVTDHVIILFFSLANHLYVYAISVLTDKHPLFQGELESRIAELETLKRQMGNTGAAESSLTVESEKVRKHFIVFIKHKLITHAFLCSHQFGGAFR